MVWQCYNAVSIPIIGMGGIMSADDAIEFMLAGASGVAVGTGNFINPQTTMNILEGIASYMSAKNIQSLNQLIGGVQC
jgi:dihydroorotate dehydrogenase (NAD+) catalytic subunit